MYAPKMLSRVIIYRVQLLFYRVVFPFSNLEYNTKIKYKVLNKGQKFQSNILPNYLQKGRNMAQPNQNNESLTFVAFEVSSCYVIAGLYFSQSGPAIVYSGLESLCKCWTRLINVTESVTFASDSGKFARESINWGGGALPRNFSMKNFHTFSIPSYSKAWP